MCEFFLYVCSIDRHVGGNNPECTSCSSTFLLSIFFLPFFLLCFFLQFIISYERLSVFFSFLVFWGPVGPSGKRRLAVNGLKGMEEERRVLSFWFKICYYIAYLGSFFAVFVPLFFVCYVTYTKFEWELWLEDLCRAERE
ncbi:hypothetical protein EV426DRAFT_411682 [Tirmania nivea]|nr:hypothetical protein EV426DRAFT_411682 [Tirmania nivea]